MFEWNSYVFNGPSVTYSNLSGILIGDWDDFKIHFHTLFLFVSLIYYQKEELAGFILNVKAFGKGWINRSRNLQGYK